MPDGESGGEERVGGERCREKGGKGEGEEGVQEDLLTGCPAVDLGVQRGS